jgi:hypothetical protein
VSFMNWESWVPICFWYSFQSSIMRGLLDEVRWWTGKVYDSGSEWWGVRK